MIFKRDPALWLLLFGTVLRLVGAFVLNFTVDQQALLNTLVAAILALIVAVSVRRDGQVAAILGLFTAMIAAAVGFGFELSAERQALIMTTVAAALSFYTRTQVTAKVGPVDTGKPTDPAI